MNGHRTDRLPNNANFSFQFIEGESLLIMLDMKGICGFMDQPVHQGLWIRRMFFWQSVCHIICKIATWIVRLTLSEETTKEEIDYVVDCLKEIVAQLQHVSPLYEDFVKKRNNKNE